MYQFESAEHEAAYRAALANEAVQHISGRIFDASGSELLVNENTIADEVFIDSRCLENEEIFNIAEMYVGELKLKINNSTVRATALIGGEIRLSFGVDTELGLITVPLGVWDIADAKRESAYTISITGHDHTARLAAPVGIDDVGVISLNTIMRQVEAAAGIEFAQTSAELLDMAVSAVNGSCVRFEGTCWEEVRLLAQIIGGFAFANREGKIEFRTFGTQPVLEITADKRFRAELQEGSFGIKGISYTDAHDKNYTTYSTISHDSSSILCIANNKWIWTPPKGTEEEYYENICREILYKVAFSDILPGTVDFYGDPTLDLGDMVHLTGGIGASSDFLISGSYWQFRGVHTLTAGGAPTVGEYVSGSSGSGSGSIVVPGGTTITKNVNSVKLVPYTGELFPTERTVARARFSCKDSTTAFLECTITVSGTKTNTINAKVIFDGTEQAIAPKETIYKGRDASLAFSIDIPVDSGMHNVKVEVSGVADLTELSGCVWGQNIISEPLDYSDAYTYSIESGEATVTGYTGDSPHVEIPEQLGGGQTKYIGGSAFTDADITTAYIPDGVCEIQDSSGESIAKEKTGTLPLTLRSDGTSLLDWRISGAAGGVGRTGKNYLRQTTTPIPNGAVGTFIEANTDGWFNGSQNIANGYSFNTKSAKRIVLVFAKSDESALSVSEVGDLMLVEGTTVPATYNADTNLYKKNIMWGGLYPHTYAPWPATYSEDGAQELYAGDNGYGGEYLYRLARSFWESRCKTYVIDVEPNTDYSVRLFGSSVTLMAYIYLLGEPDTITQEFVSADYTGGGVCAIPSCGEYVTDTEQWCRLDCIVTGGSSTQSSIVAVDTRPNKYEFCESFAELEAGTYKLMVEVLGNHILRQGGIGFASYGGNIYDSYTPTSAYTPSNVYERFALVAEDDTLIIPETNIFDSTTVRNSETAPYPNFFHKEYTFTLTKKTKVGVIHRAYSNAHNYWSGDADLYAYFRFMICNADVEAEEFESTNLYANISGESAWEPYRCYLPLTIRNGENEQTVDIDLGASLLEAGETVSFSGTHTAIPTYSGVNTITTDSVIQPAEMYVKYSDNVSGAFMNAAELEYVNIPESVKYIGEYAFTNTALKKVRIARDCEFYPTSFPDDCQIWYYGDKIFPDNSGISFYIDDSGYISIDYGSDE